MPATDLPLLVSAAQAAGDIAMAHFGADPQVWDKPDGAGPVTAADLAVDAHLTQVLRQALPDYGWLSEETPDDTARLGTRHCFVIDPIDGTRAFIEGAKDWAISVAVVTDGAPDAAVVHMPARGRTYAAALGQGTTRDGARCSVRQGTDLSAATVLAARPSMAPEHWTIVPPVKRTFRSSLAYRMALVAEGAFDAMMTFRPTWEWDIAAGALLVSEAGGRATDATGRALVFNSAAGQTPGVVAGGGVHEGLISRRA